MYPLLILDVINNTGLRLDKELLVLGVFLSECFFVIFRLEKEQPHILFQ